MPGMKKTGSKLSTTDMAHILDFIPDDVVVLAHNRRVRVKQNHPLLSLAKRGGETRRVDNNEGSRI